MTTIIDNLRNPMFASKGWYLLFLPLTFLHWKHKAAIVDFAHKHWKKNPTIMHRLSGACK